MFVKFSKCVFDLKQIDYLRFIVEINDILSGLTKAHDLLPASQMSGRKSRSCETVLELLTEQIHTI
jgi:hypothetical protein